MPHVERERDAPRTHERAQRGVPDQRPGQQAGAQHGAGPARREHGGHHGPGVRGRQGEPQRIRDQQREPRLARAQRERRLDRVRADRRGDPPDRARSPQHRRTDDAGRRPRRGPAAEDPGGHAGPVQRQPPQGQPQHEERAPGQDGVVARDRQIGQQQPGTQQVRGAGGEPEPPAHEELLTAQGGLRGRDHREHQHRPEHEPRPRDHPQGAGAQAQQGQREQEEQGVVAQDDGHGDAERPAREPEHEQQARASGDPAAQRRAPDPRGRRRAPRGQGQPDAGQQDEQHRGASGEPQERRVRRPVRRRRVDDVDGDHAEQGDPAGRVDAGQPATRGPVRADGGGGRGGTQGGLLSGRRASRRGHGRRGPPVSQVGWGP